MVTQICPKCRKKSFTWYISEVLSNITVWSCTSCPFQIFEDDNEEVICINCNEKTNTFLQNQEEQFNWCSNCDTMTKYQINE